MLSLLKIPALCSLTYFSTLLYRDPNPPPPKKAQEKYGQFKQIGGKKTFSKLMTFLGKVFILGSDFGECFMILLCHSRWLPLVDTAVPYLFPSSGGCADIGVTWVSIVGWALAMFGVVVRLASMRNLGKFFTFDLAVYDDHKLITSGPYAYVRHPSYLGTTSNFIGHLILRLGPGSWLYAIGLWNTILGRIGGTLWAGMMLLFVARIWHRTLMEDKVLRAEFGKEWDDWAKRTPYRVVPGIF